MSWNLTVLKKQKMIQEMFKDSPFPLYGAKKYLHLQTSWLIIYSSFILNVYASSPHVMWPKLPTLSNLTYILISKRNTSYILCKGFHAVLTWIRVGSQWERKSRGRNYPLFFCGLREWERTNFSTRMTNECLWPVKIQVKGNGSDLSHIQSGGNFLHLGLNCSVAEGPLQYRLLDSQQLTHLLQIYIENKSFKYITLRM